MGGVSMIRDAPGMAMRYACIPRSGTLILLKLSTG